MSAYSWCDEPPTDLPSALAPVHRPAPGRLAGLVDGGVAWVLKSTGLLDALERVTGDGSALHTAGELWLEQAHILRDAATRLRRGAAALPASWRGGAADAFGEYMGRCAAGLDAAAGSLAETARILNQAGIEAAVAEDVVTGIVDDAAEWAAAELAATVIADLLTLGAASLAGGVAESATMAVYAGRAAKVSADLGKELESLAHDLATLRDARDALDAATGVRKLRELRKTRDAMLELSHLGRAFRAADLVAEQATGLATGLPVGHQGTRWQRLGTVIGDDVVETVIYGAVRS